MQRTGDGNRHERSVHHVNGRYGHTWREESLRRVTCRHTIGRRTPKQASSSGRRRGDQTPLCVSGCPAIRTAKECRSGRAGNKGECQELATLYAVGRWAVFTKVAGACQPLSSCCQKRRGTKRLSGQTGHRRRFFADRVLGVPALNCMKMPERLRKEKILGVICISFLQFSSGCRRFWQGPAAGSGGAGGGVRCLGSVDTVCRL